MAVQEQVIGAWAQYGGKGWFESMRYRREGSRHRVFAERSRRIELLNMKFHRLKFLKIVDRLMKEKRIPFVKRVRRGSRLESMRHGIDFKLEFHPYGPDRSFDDVLVSVRSSWHEYFSFLRAHESGQVYAVVVNDLTQAGHVADALMSIHGIELNKIARAAILRQTGTL